MRRAEGGAKILGYFVWKITILRQKKNHIFSNFRGGACRVQDKIKSQIINGFLFCLQTSRWHILNIVVPLLWILTIIENCMLSVFRLWKVSCIDYFIQIYHVWEGYLRKIPVERRTISRDEWRMKFSLKTGIFHKYSSQTWYMFNYTEYYFRTLAK